MNHRREKRSPDQTDRELDRWLADALAAHALNAEAFAEPAAASIEVRPGFTDAVMSRIAQEREAAVPARVDAPSWRSWALAAAMLLVGAVALVGLGLSDALSRDAGPMASVLGAVATAASSAALAGADLLGASWQRVSGTLSSWFGGGATPWVALAVVVALNLVLVGMLRRRWARALSGRR